MNAPVILGEIESPRPLRAVGGAITITGWCVERGAGSAPAVRLVMDDRTWSEIARIKRPDVAGLLPEEIAAAASGFSLTAEVPAGVHLARFLAETSGGQWVCWKELVLAAVAAPFTAILDEPIRQGVLGDRVKVGGWAVDRTQRVDALWLRYGHREIACEIGRPRTDVPRVFPGIGHAAEAGFESSDFLVAGHGPVRIRARLADGRVAIAPTEVVFSISTDENHGPELDLTAERIALPGYGAPQPIAAPPAAAQVLNILFLLPGSFASNNALHVAGLANELAAAGHRCAVAVAHDPDTIAHHAAPAFAALSHPEAEAHRFADERGPDIVHAWTTREAVRRLTERLRQRHGCRIVVHLEDNEQEVLALSLRRHFSELDALDDAELDRLVPDDLSHPHRSREFLAAANGVTCITGRLREFVPASSPCLVLMPAADERYFSPRPLPREFRQVLDVSANTTVVFYHGNVHAANAAEVRELYAAIARLNETGTPVTLVRTGLDTVDFLGAHAARIRPHVIELGQILHHRHLPPLMALADVFVQPGASDAFNDYRFPSKLPEFFALGRPVVLPRTNLGELVRHGTDAFVLERADAAGIAEAIRQLRADPALAQRLAEGAVAFAAKHFSWRRSAEALAKFYAALTAS